MNYLSKLIFYFLSLSLINAIEIGGSWEELDDKLKSGDFSKLPEGTMKFRENYYTVVKLKTDWNKAKMWCEERGGHLATITSNEENTFIAKLLRDSNDNKNGQFFVGAINKETKGKWKWITGEKFDFTDWAPNEPNNSDNIEHYMTIYQNDSIHWNDAPVSHKIIEGFIIEWEGSVLNKKILSDAQINFPKTLLTMHKIMQQKLSTAKKSGDEKTYTMLIKAYGKKIVAQEKSLTRQRKLKEAKAVRAVKLELIALLAKNKPATTAKLKPKMAVAKSKIYVLIDDGDVKYGIKINRDQWKKKADTLESIAKNAKIILPEKIVGKGDFSLSARIKLDRIGDTWPMMKIGETETGIDGPTSKAWVQFGAFYQNELKGERTAGVVDPDTFFDWKLERKGSVLTISVNQKILYKNAIHTDTLGAISLSSGAAKMTLQSLIFEGILRNKIKTTSVIASHNNPELHYDIGQVLHMRKKGFISLYKGYNNGGTRRIRIHYSKDNGNTWEDKKILENSIEGRAELSTFSTIFNTKRNVCHLLFTRGDSNQKVYYSNGKSYAKMWSKSVEITNLVKDKGWDVAFTNCGLVTKYGRKSGQALIPYHAGKEVKNLYLLQSYNGKDWRRIGPILKGTSGSASLVEFSDGKLLLASGGAENLRTSMSEDGGLTWAKEINSNLSINLRRGSLTIVKTSEKQEILLYVGSTNIREDKTSNLNLWASKDHGKTWTDLGVICYGPSYYPNLIPLSDGKFGLFVHSYNHWNRAQQRYHVLKLSSFGL